ncbi:MAG: hypothetical protein J6F30_12245 [Cellulosilyticum sp.]|nr:hypothetical protein [Cellulosilyticum sp.]
MIYWLMGVLIIIKDIREKKVKELIGVIGIAIICGILPFLIRGEKIELIEVVEKILIIVLGARLGSYYIKAQEE